MQTLPQTGPITRAALQFQNPLAGDSIKPPAQRNPLNTLMQTPLVSGFADGGLIGGAVDAIKNRKNALDAAEAAANPSPVPQPAATPAKVSMGSEADNYAAQAAKIEAEQQAAAKARIEFRIPIARAARLIKIR